MGNQEIRRNWQHCVHKKQDEDKQNKKHIEICVGHHFTQINTNNAGLTLGGDSGEEVALWLLTSLCTSAKREVEVAL